MPRDTWKATFKTYHEIRTAGAIGNLNEGPEIRTHGIAARLIAWPGNGYQTESVHVLTLRPGDESTSYAYALAEEAMLCHKGRGQVYLRGQWVDVEAGDMAYFPEGVPHAVRNPRQNGADLILVSQITPPQFDLYQERGFYHRELGVMNREAIFKATINAGRGQLSTTNEMDYSEASPEVRAWNLSAAEVRHGGALFNVYRGTPFTGLGIPMRLIIWPGAGSRTAGFNLAFAPPGIPDVIHTHPVSDECLILWAGSGQVNMGAGWLDVEANDVVLAPCGVLHGHRNDAGPCFWGGFASPPQLDLLMNTAYYQHGLFRQADYQRFTAQECPGIEQLVPRPC